MSEPVYPATDAIKLEVQISADTSWTDIYPDVMADPPLELFYGNRSDRPDQRTAQGGHLKFTLDNSTGNSGGLIGYYSPGSSDVQTGWQEGVNIRYSILYDSDTYYKWCGRVNEIVPEHGESGPRTVKVSAVDWINDATRIKPEGLGVQESKSGDQLVTTLLTGVTQQPTATQYDSGISNFEYCFDEIRDRHTTAQQVLKNITMSEFGRCAQIGDSDTGGVLRWWKRHAWNQDTDVLLTMDNDGDSDDYEDIVILATENDVFNTVRATTYPRAVDTDQTVILWELQGDGFIGASDQKTIFGKYTDPNNRDTRIAGAGFQEPEGQNDLMNYDFEDGIAYWVPLQGAIVQSSDQAHNGNYSVKFTTHTGTIQPYIRPGNPNFVGDYRKDDLVRWQYYYYLPDAWPTNISTLIVEWDSNGDWIQNDTIETFTPSSGSWNRRAGSALLTASDCAAISIIPYSASASSDFDSNIIYFDDFYLIQDSNLSFEFGANGCKNDNLVFSSATFGGNSVKFVIENTGPTGDILNRLEAKGSPVYVYQPAIAEAIDSDSIASYGDRNLNLKLIYQDNPLEGQDFADAVLADHKARRSRVKRVKFTANRNDALMKAACQGEPGDRITLSELVAGISKEDYHINGVLWKDTSRIIDVTWFTVLSDTNSYYRVETDAIDDSDRVIAY